MKYRNQILTSFVSICEIVMRSRFWKKFFKILNYTIRLFSTKNSSTQLHVNITWNYFVLLYFSVIHVIFREIMILIHNGKVWSDLMNWEKMTFSESDYTDEWFDTSICRISQTNFPSIQIHTIIIVWWENINCPIRSILPLHDYSKLMDFQIKNAELLAIFIEDRCDVQSTIINPFSWYDVIIWFRMDMTLLFDE